MEKQEIINCIMTAAGKTSGHQTVRVVRRDEYTPNDDPKVITIVKNYEGSRDEFIKN